jgi:Beta-1,4-xylanase
MKSNIIKSVMTAALLGGAVSAFAGPGLADGAAKFVGNITTRGAVRSDFTQLWNQITAENECKWASIEGTRGNYNWRGCDAAYNWAKQNGGHFKFHALVWGSQYPNWLNGLSAADTKTAITNWMDAVAKHYPDLEMIDVVNEAIKSGGKYHSNYGSQGNNNIINALGGDNGNYEFVAEAFRMARKRWPNAILIYNDYNTVQWQKNEGIDLIQKLKKAGAPVDAYGLQAHDMQVSGGQAGGQGGGGSCLNINTLKSAIEEIWNKTQIPLFISEYDIASNDDNDQKNCYSQQISYFMENEHIAGITIWGYLYGATWTSGGNSGIIRESNGKVTDRPAMTWLKDYLSKNKGVNTTGLATGEVTPVEPVPQEPFKGTPIAVPGKIEVEDFDIPGQGKNEDGSSNASYGDDGENHGDSQYRKDTGADLYEKATGVILGYNQEGDWFEYTINVAEAGDYTAIASVASDGTGAFTLSIDGKSVAEFEVTGSSFDEFSDVKKKISLTAGKHVLRLDVTKQYFDIDYINIVKGDGEDPGQGGDNPGQGGDDPGVGIRVAPVHYEVPTLGAYDVFDMNGVRLGRMSAYTMDEAVSTLKNTSDIKVQGIYMLRSVKNGMVKTVRVIR